MIDSRRISGHHDTISTVFRDHWQLRYAALFACRARGLWNSVLDIKQIFYSKLSAINKFTPYNLPVFVNTVQTPDSSCDH